MFAYRKLHKKLNYLSPEDQRKVYAAYQIACKAHSKQKRSSGEKYIVHPLAVAEILAGMYFDYQTLAAALLHDVVEDTDVTKKEITEQFGETVAAIVDGLTKLSLVEASGSLLENQAQNFRKMLLAMSRDVRVIIIKLADRLHNMRTVASLASLKKKRIAKETLEIYAPIAHRLGMHEIYTQLEDLAFVTLYPRRYRILEKSITQIYGRQQKSIKILMNELEQIFSKNGMKENVISGRKKHLYSIYKKMLEQSISLSNIMDLYGIRVVVPSVDDCYRTLGLIHSLYKPMNGKFKDYIASPKLNGYQSLHTVLFGPQGTPVEIQIRTQEMDQIATSGVAAHWAYKGREDAVNQAQLMVEHWVSKLLEFQFLSANPTEFFESVKMELYPDKVFVFTPKGDILELPRGATALDFAYAIHTDIGNCCLAVRINRKFLPLSTPLINGQIISVLTSHEAEPSPTWLNFAVTTKARHSIRSYLKNKRHEELVLLGKHLLDRAISEIPFTGVVVQPVDIEKFAKKNNLADVNQLYENIGLGNQLAVLVAYQLVNHGTLASEAFTTKPLLIKDSKGMAISFASCCYPIPGDPIAGYLNAACGLDVHVQDCPTLAKINRHLERSIKIAWDSKITGDFKVGVVIEVVNRLGAVAAVTNAISKTNAKIGSIHSDASNSDYIKLSIVLLVKNNAHLQRIKRHISSVPLVIGVSRKSFKDRYNYVD